MKSGIDVLRGRIEAEIARREWSVRQASLGAGLSESTLKNFLSGKRKGMDSETARSIAQAFGWSEDETLALAGHRSPAGLADPMAALRESLGAERWDSDVRRALLVLAEATDRQAWAQRVAGAVDDVLAEPMAARRGELDRADYARLVARTAIERVFGPVPG